MFHLSLWGFIYAYAYIFCELKGKVRIFYGSVLLISALSTCFLYMKLIYNNIIINKYYNKKHTLYTQFASKSLPYLLNLSRQNIEMNIVISKMSFSLQLGEDLVYVKRGA